MKSLQQKLAQLEGLIDTKDVSDWENGFLKDITKADRRGHPLSDKQLDVVERIYSKHFA